MSVLHLSGEVRRTRELRCAFVDLLCSRRAALKRLPTQGAAKKLAGLRSQPVECLAGRHRVLQCVPKARLLGDYQSAGMSPAKKIYFLIRTCFLIRFLL